MKAKIENLGTTQHTDSSKEGLLAEVILLEDRATKLRDNVYLRDNALLFISLATVFSIILLFTSYAVLTSVSKQNLTFRNDIIKITPHVSINTIDRLKSNWAQIADASDFNKVKTQTDSIKYIYKIR